MTLLENIYKRQMNKKVRGNKCLIWPLLGAITVPALNCLFPKISIIHFSSRTYHLATNTEAYIQKSYSNGKLKLQPLRNCI